MFNLESYLLGVVNTLIVFAIVKGCRWVTKAFDTFIARIDKIDSALYQVNCTLNKIHKPNETSGLFGFIWPFVLFMLTTIAAVQSDNTASVQADRAASIQSLIGSAVNAVQADNTASIQSLIGSAVNAVQAGNTASVQAGNTASVQADNTASVQADRVALIQRLIGSAIPIVQPATNATPLRRFSSDVSSDSESESDEDPPVTTNTVEIPSV